MIPIGDPPLPTRALIRCDDGGRWNPSAYSCARVHWTLTGLPSGEGQSRRLGLDRADRLAAEGPADPAGLDRDRPGRQCEGIGQKIADIEGVLRSGPDPQRAVLP
jgi:hypothetical protein